MVFTLGRNFQDLPSDMRCILQEDTDKHRPVSSKLCCTLGPSSRDVATISKLLQAGMKVARFDFTWGTSAYHQETLDNLREALEETDSYCAVAMETSGREILVLNKPETAIHLKQGDVVTLTCDHTAQASSSVLPISTLSTFEGHGIAPGGAIFVGQYLFTGSETSSAYLTVQKVDGVTCTCVCNNTCSLEGYQLTVHVMGLVVPGPALSPEDTVAIETWGKANQVDFVSLAYTRSAEDVESCRALLQSCGLKDTMIIAKIECLEGLKAHMEIIEAADVIIFSRGNFGTSLDPEKVFLAQKVLLRACNMGGKPVYVTRVVDTMSEAPRPTRAEATDVANLVLDGADGILLGSETFRGKYPELAAQTVVAICRQAEECFSSQAFYRATMETFSMFDSVSPDISKPEAIASSAVRAADKTAAKLIIVFTVTGRTASLLSKYKPKQPILTLVCPTTSAAMYSEAKLSPSKTSMVRSTSMASLKGNRHGSTVMRQCLSYRGVIPIMANPDLKDSAELLEYAITIAKNMGLVTGGDRIIVSQCPRKVNSDLMAEAGVVSLVEVDA